MESLKNGMGRKQLNTNHGMYPYLEQIEKNERRAKVEKLNIKQILWFAGPQIHLTFLLCNNITNFRKFGNSGLPKLLNLVILSSKCRVFIFKYVLGMYVPFFSKNTLTSCL